MYPFIHRITDLRSRPDAIATLALGAAVSVFIYAGGEAALWLLAGLSGAALLVLFVYRYPVATIALWALLTEIADEVVSIFLNAGGQTGLLQIGGGIDVRLSDPLLLGIAGALVVELIFGSAQSRRRFLTYGSLWLLLMGWLLFQVARSVGTYGVVSTLGEFRTTFEPLLIFPYFVLFFRTRPKVLQLFYMLLAASLLFIVVGLTAGGILYGFSFAAYDKWLLSYASLALVLGGFTLYLMYRYGFWQRGPALYAGMLLVTLSLTIISGHRSVWLAAVAASGFLMLAGEIPLSKAVRLGAALLLAGVVVDALFAQVDLLAFVHERLTAFTASTQDASTSWRLQIWQDAWRQAQHHLWEGKGFGSYFRFHDSRGNLVTVSLHNQYLQLVYQVGILGLALYLAFAVQTARQLWAAYARTSDPLVRLATCAALTALVAGSAYYLAYAFNDFTWLYVGLGLAAAALPASHVALPAPQPLLRSNR